MPALDIRILHANSSHSSAIVAVLTDAFFDGTVARWLDPDPDTRLINLAAHFDTLAAETLSNGIVHIAADPDGQIVGAALWMPHAATHTPHLTPPGDADDPATAAVLERTHLLELMLAVRHPVRTHHHLTCLGVHPNAQTRGVGTQLLRRHHRHLDRSGRSAYLEANDPRNHDLYTRHGYTDCGPPILDPGAGTPIWPMWRAPHQGSA